MENSQTVFASRDVGALMEYLLFQRELPNWDQPNELFCHGLMMVVEDQHPYRLVRFVGMYGPFLRDHMYEDTAALLADVLRLQRPVFAGWEEAWRELWARLPSKVTDHFLSWSD